MYKQNFRRNWLKERLKTYIVLTKDTLFELGMQYLFNEIYLSKLEEFLGAIGNENVPTNVVIVDTRTINFQLKKADLDSKNFIYITHPELIYIHSKNKLLYIKLQNRSLFARFLTNPMIYRDKLINIRLKDKESDILSLLIEGKSLNYIASKFQRSVKTISGYKIKIHSHFAITRFNVSVLNLLRSLPLKNTRLLT